MFRAVRGNSFNFSQPEWILLHFTRLPIIVLSLDGFTSESFADEFTNGISEKKRMTGDEKFSFSLLAFMEKMTCQCERA